MAVAIIVLVFLFSLFNLFKFFSPNYIEFGPYIALHRDKECTNIDDHPGSSKDCRFRGRSISMWKNNPKTVLQALQKVIDIVNRERLPSNYPQNANKWGCAVNGRIIIDNQTEIAQDNTTYKCWPE